MAFRNFDDEGSDDGAETFPLTLQDREDTEFYQKITDMLLGAGYFRARLTNIEPFDKILGGLTWCIIGLMYSAEMDFRDDLSLGEKLKLAETVTDALVEMRCPHQLFPHEIQNCTFEKILPVMQWLINLLLKTRDKRGSITKKQAIQSFNRRFDKNIGKDRPKIDKLYDLSERIKPKRAFKSTRIDGTKLEDPKRVHACLREFNDPSASRLYKRIMEDISRQVRTKERERMQKETEEGLGNVEEVKKGDKQMNSITKTIDEIKNMKKDDTYKDINEDFMVTESGEQVKTELDEEISKLKQRTFKVKAGDVNQILTQNIDQLSSEVQNFQKMSEEALKQDEEFFIQSRKEELERELLRKRKEIKEKQLDNERQILEQKRVQFKEIKAKYEENLDLGQNLDRDIESLSTKISQCPVTEEDLKKVHKKEQLKNDIKDFKKKCREERDRLEAELQKIKEKNERIRQEQYAQALKAIEDKYNAQYEKLMERKMKIAEQNRHITALQRKIENCPSKIELSQYHKRFTELYESINDKFEENRKYISLYNTRQEVKNLLSRQQNYMDEIKKEFVSTKGKKERTNLLENLENIVVQLNDRITQSFQILTELRAEKEKTVEDFNDILQKEKDHFNRIKIFEAECSKNELLMNQYQEIKKDKKKKEAPQYA